MSFPIGVLPAGTAILPQNLDYELNTIKMEMKRCDTTQYGKTLSVFQRMEAAGRSETVTILCQTTQGHIPENNKAVSPL
jgi:hypothetical protein